MLDRGLRLAATPEFSNIQVDVIIPPEVAETLLQRLHTDFFPKVAMVIYESDIRVLRPHRF